MRGTLVIHACPVDRSEEILCVAIGCQIGLHICVREANPIHREYPASIEYKHNQNRSVCPLVELVRSPDALDMKLRWSARSKVQTRELMGTAATPNDFGGRHIADSPIV
jgi:hypothetical protein